MTDIAPPQLTTDPGYRLEYIVRDETWYAGADRRLDDRPALTVVKSADGGGCDWEFQIKDYTAELREPAIQAQVFHDAFAAYTEIAPFFAALAAERPSSLAEVQGILDRLGFADGTQRTEPRA